MRTITWVVSLFVLPYAVQAAQEVGTEVCYEGFIMDTYCSVVGFFPHSLKRTLHVPDKHTVHCLIDDALCIQSGFELLHHRGDISDTGLTSPYCRAYKLDQAGNDMIVHLAKSIGVCDDCYSNTTGAWVDGFRATVKGTIKNVGSPTAPATLAVTEVLESSVGCDGGNVEPDEEHCILETAGLTDDDSPCHEEGDYCKELGETKPPAPTDSPTGDSGSNSVPGMIFSVLASFVPLLFML